MPTLTHHDLLSVGHPRIDGISLTVSILQELVRILGPLCLQNVEHVGAVWVPWLTVRVLVWKVQHELGVLLNLGPDLLDRELVKFGHLDGAKISVLEQFLVVLQDQLEVVLVDHVVWW